MHIQQWLPGYRRTPIFIRSLLKCIFDLLIDGELLGPGGSNLRLPHPTDPLKRMPDTRPDRISELCDGKWWHESMLKYLCEERGEMLLPLIFVCDKSQTDLQSKLSVTPFLFTLGIFSIAKRKESQPGECSPI